MDTHPPLADRIRAIDPSFDGNFPPVGAAEVERAGSASSPLSSDRPFRFLSPVCQARKGAWAGSRRRSSPPRR